MEQSGTQVEGDGQTPGSKLARGWALDPTSKWTWIGHCPGAAVDRQTPALTRDGRGAEFWSAVATACSALFAGRWLCPSLPVR